MEEGTRKYIPSYLRERYQLLGTVTFAALFSVLFLLVSIPFSNNAWFRLGNSTFFGFTALFAPSRSPSSSQARSRCTRRGTCCP